MQTETLRKQPKKKLTIITPQIKEKIRISENDLIDFSVEV